MKKVVVGALTLALTGLFACGNQETSKEVEVAIVEEELSNLEKEHLLERVAYADSVNAGLLEDTFKGSARREAKASMGGTDITINYGSPGMRGRVIWNGLVSYDQVWVSGSHWATAVTFSKDVTIDGVTVPAGMYGFFTIPGREEWTLILNKVYDQHLADEYDEAEDVVRVKVSPETLATPVQRLTYEILMAGESEVEIALSWDTIRVRMPVSI
ncbi:MAG: DUF2911 domain-containing protein [Mongoliitalea sp.]